jgi:peptide/nickel transport system permease protein
MLSYIIRRLIFAVPTLIAVSIVAFVLIQLPPGDVTSAYQAALSEYDEAAAQEVIEGIKQRYGLDKPIYVQYFYWIGGMFKGNFGESVMYRRDVGSLIASRLKFTVLVTLSTMAFTWIIGIPIGVYSATHQYSFLDNLFSLLSFGGRSIPNFLMALLLMMAGLFFFNISVGGLFSSEYIDAPWSFDKFIDLLKHLWIPVVVIGVAGTAGTIRVMRGNLLDVLNQPYIITGRAKGLQERKVIYKYGVRNAIHPLIMSLGMSLPQIISGATIVSIVLNLPTMGPVLFTALTSQDMYLAGTILFFQVILLIIGNLLADIMLAWVDPRIRYE